MMTRMPPALQRVAIVGTYLPRQCGIATFSASLYHALAEAAPDVSWLVLPVNDRPAGYPYGFPVRFEIAEGDIAAYRRAADFLNSTGVDLVCLQHEYGIFGGIAGSHVVALLRDLRMPVVTTLHTVLRAPDPAQRRVLDELAARSDRLVVMTRRGAEFLREIYGVAAEKIEVIPHGIPDVPFVDPNFYKDQFGVEGRQVLLTFGLLSAHKGIEVVIDALPAILARHPHVVYVVLGATHPHVLRREGESYRLALLRRAQALGVDPHVLFHNRFVTEQELVEWIGATDLYLTPYRSVEQITSGTLAYAVGAGKAVISTPYWHAEELLADGRGVLVPFGDADALARAVVDLLDNESERHAMRKRAYLLGREMTWPVVARRYLALFERVRAERMRAPRPFVVKTQDARPAELPPLRLDHLERMTDDVGLLQHAVFTVPNRQEGYTTDDNARALAATVLLENLGDEAAAVGARLAPRYLAFLWHAFDASTGRFRNVLGYDRRWHDQVGSEDAYGRALWALGLALGRSEDAGLRGAAGRLFERALAAAGACTSPRAWAMTALGCCEYLRAFGGDRLARGVAAELADRLLAGYRAHRTDDWRWFEDVVAYANPTLPHALLVVGTTLQRSDAIAAGLEALEWLFRLQQAPDGHFVPIGCHGFYRRGGERARFDQQPLEAQTMVGACLAAHRVTEEARWHRRAQRAFEWFLGANDLGLPLYDPATGGCRDGLHPDRVNQNQGAESTLAFILALLELRLAQHVVDRADRVGADAAPAAVA
ncbi:MAG: glycosyltransferase family 4 protein [Armatimonadota bacterium]|nr:glycosyltransferase family 4 protein [Armatimonadota bacterium]MDR7485736.1 glycosyltransferase family 4 protein [Armatimonadota bacterium]MDR7534147.1 glycosyltransferase family 4 protein [Armatimonadota bacterium]MDR7536400.1 glycosyltransferase family 4 protein [Armatimonadota bacterium]